MTIKSKIDLEDFIIRVKPILNNRQDWTGEVDVSVVSSADNPLSDDDYYGVLEFCRVMCATVPLMEKDDDLRNKAIEWIEKEDKMYHKNNSKKGKVVDRHDNVVVLSFDSETKGNS